ncbi:MAG: tetraacyldisaccharide 4'-kinase [Planctomycetes bacterium RBG_16_55_9]|nr:MAG: tetraacyldisaccharide 4'-kinase [Planctomycetes bacterium RBG_16_55_9]
MDEQAYRRLISGQSNGLLAGLLRYLLGFAAIGYSFVVRLRNFSYSREWLKVHHVDAAVICVGNITTGGTGKTPLVVWVHNQVISNLRSQISNSRSQISDFPCVILTRGYKAARDPGLKTQDYSDEIAILAESCPGARVIVNPDRVAGAMEAIRTFGAKVLIMDDGFQHRRLARDLDIVAIDATNPFGYGKMLPAGLLRESINSLKRADAVVITRCDQIAEADIDELEKRLRAIHPDMVVARAIHAPVHVEYTQPTVIPPNAEIQIDNENVDSCLRRNDNIGQLKGKRVFAFCGIGNPDAFLDTVRSLGCELVGSKVYDDHYHYTQDGLAGIRNEAARVGADLILTTQKDWTKVISDFKSFDCAQDMPQISNFKSQILRLPLRQAQGFGSPGQALDSKSPVPFAYLAIEIKFLAGRDQLTALIQEALAGRI